MAASEDELAKKQVQEAVWEWTGRIIVLAVTFGFGLFAGWYLWARGMQGAPALREKVVEMDAQLLDFKNRRVDVEGQLVVVRGRLDQCQTELARARSAPGATPSVP
jgi:hypothetical protein